MINLLSSIAKSQKAISFQVKELLLTTARKIEHQMFVSFRSTGNDTDDVSCLA